MWWTDDEQAEKNSLLRAVSGGPIYVSDKIGRSRRELLAPLILDDGRILRCDRPGIPTEDCLMSDPRESGSIFKVQNIADGSGVIAAFNLQSDESACDGTVSPMDVTGLKGDEFAVYEHFTKDMKLVKYDGKINVKLNNNDDFRLYIIVPVKNGFAPIGRTDKFISPKTVKYADGERIKLIEAGEYAYVKDGKLIISEDRHGQVFI